MKYVSGLFVLGLATILVAQTSNAQTPDGETPAEEAVCDPLKDDGITKGLYGLCVAFCEAQDHAEFADSITEEELEALANSAPSGKILANFNKKKTETDPAMPCIKIEEPCPCWSTNELESIDGYLASGVSVNLLCLQAIPVGRSIVEGLNGGPQQVAQARRSINPGTEYCHYFNDQEKPRITRTLSIKAGTLELEQFESCLAQVEARCDSLGL